MRNQELLTYSEALVVAHRRISLWFIALITITLVFWWQHPFALIDLAWIAGFFIVSRFCAYVLCLCYPTPLWQWLIILGSGGMVGVILLLEFFNPVIS